MESTVLPSCTLYHSGNFDGAMYLESVGTGQQHQVVVTRVVLEDLLREQPNQAVIEVAGPDGLLYDRLEATDPNDRNLMRVGAGSFRTKKLLVHRKDIETVVLKYRTRKIEQMSRIIARPNLPFANVMGDLDAICGQLEAMARVPFEHRTS